MITKTCDRCDTLLKFSDDMAGMKVECPDCGDMNRLPDNPGPRSGDRATKAGLPPDSGPEQNVCVVAPAMWRAHPFLTLFTLGIGTLVLWIYHLGDRLHISNKRTILKKGLLNRSSTEVLHDHVRNVQIDQTFLNRIFNVGRIGISSSGQDGVEIIAHAVPRPAKVKETIDLYRPL